MPFVVIGLSHHSCPRHGAGKVPTHFWRHGYRIRCNNSRDSGSRRRGAVILSTCNRVELYAVTPLEPADAFRALREFLVNYHDYRDPIADELYTLGEPHSLEHLFKGCFGA